MLNSSLEELEDAKVLIKYSNNMQNIYKNIKEHNPSKKWNVLIDMNALISNDLMT